MQASCIHGTVTEDKILAYKYQGWSEFPSLIHNTITFTLNFAL